jgi:hypothetical protein
MQARLAKYRGPIENGTQTPLGKSFCLGREIAVTLQRAGITRVEPLDGNGWMVLLRGARGCKTGKVSEVSFTEFWGANRGCLCLGYEYEGHGQNERGMRCTKYHEQRR